MADFKVEVPDADVKTYVTENFDPGDIYDSDDLTEYVANNFDPGDVFSDDDLNEWAQSNGYNI